MKYQDLRVRDAGRIALMAGFFTGATVVSFVFPAATARLGESLGLSRQGSDYWMFVSLVAIMGSICWLMVIKYLVSSPADDARTFAALVAKGKPPPTKFNPALLDATDPSFSIPTWRYAYLRWRRGR